MQSPQGGYPVSGWQSYARAHNMDACTGSIHEWLPHGLAISQKGHTMYGTITMRVPMAPSETKLISFCSTTEISQWELGVNFDTCAAVWENTLQSYV